MSVNCQGSFKIKSPFSQPHSLCVGLISDADLGRCLTADGHYLYTTNSAGRGLSKLGSGLHGTLRSVWGLPSEAQTRAQPAKEVPASVLIPHASVSVRRCEPGKAEYSVRVPGAELQIVGSCHMGAGT